MKISTVKKGEITGFTLTTEAGEYAITIVSSDSEYYVSGPRWISGGKCEGVEDCIAKVAHAIALEEIKVHEFDNN